MTELVVVSAADDRALVDELARLVDFIDRVPDVALLDVAYTCSLARGSSVLAVIAEDIPGLRARLASARDRIAAGNLRRIRDKSGTYFFREHLLGEGNGKLAFVYPGVLGFYHDMLRDLAIDNPECRSAFDELEEAMVGIDEFTPSSFIFPPAHHYRHDADIFKSGAYAQALVSTYAACVALTRLLKSAGVNPHGVVGFAGGDLAAMMRSGAAGAEPPRPDRVRVIREIYNIVDKAVNHGGLPEVAMITVVLRRPDELDWLTTKYPSEKIIMAVDFSSRQRTYAVASEIADDVIADLTAAGVRAVKLALDRPFNTPLCASLVPAIRKFVSGWMKREPVYEIYSCANAQRLPAGLKAARDDTAGRWDKAVLFEDTVRQMYADGYQVFLEVGPRGLMTSAVADTLRGSDHAAIALNSVHRSGILQAQHAFAQLAALGQPIDLSATYERRKARKLDFSAAISLEVRRDAERKLSRLFPKLMLIRNDTPLRGDSAMAPASGRGARAAARHAAVLQQTRRQRQFDFGAIHPLVSDATILESSPGVSIEITKVFRLSEMPFIGDFALGTSQVAYTDPNLKGLVLLTLSVGTEIMAEVASQVVPNRNIVRIEDLQCRRRVAFVRGALTLYVRAERIPARVPAEAAVKVQIREDSPNSAYTWPVMEATVVVSDTARLAEPLNVEPLEKPRSVHWSGRDIYPARLCCGSRLRGINFVDAWSEYGLDYEVVVPPLPGNVAFTRFPMWVVNPVLMGTIVNGFPLWRSHERFAGAFSFPFRMRRLEFHGYLPEEGGKLKCYLRLTGVTPKSHLCNITVTDGNGKVLMTISGWEELTERVPVEYCQLVLQPAVTYLTEPLTFETMGNPITDVSSAFITDVPYPIFERNEELWLKTLSHIILDADERRNFMEMTSSTKRRVEWLFGRVAAKEAVRRYLKDFYQARWSDADIKIWQDDSGKPHAIGGWDEYLTTKLDIAIAHTSQFIVAVAAANARVGVDVELTTRDLSEEFTAGVFSSEELGFALHAVNSAQAIIRFWCAKEAVSKALGTGIRYSPKEMVVTGYEPDTGKLTIELRGAWVEAFKQFRGRNIPVIAKTQRDHALAFCFIPSTLFAEES